MCVSVSIRRVRMWNFTRIGPKTKKVMAFDTSGTKAVRAARLGTTPKRCELQLLFAGIRQALWRYIWSFSRIAQKIKKNYSSFNFLAENLEKFRSTGHYGAALEGSTIFLCRSSLGSTAMESCRLAELKYAIFSRAGRRLKNYRVRSSFYRWPLSMGS